MAYSECKHKDSVHPFKNKGFCDLIKIWKVKPLEADKFEKCHRDNTGIDYVCSYSPEAVGRGA